MEFASGGDVVGAASADWFVFVLFVSAGSEGFEVGVAGIEAAFAAVEGFDGAGGFA